MKVKRAFVLIAALTIACSLSAQTKAARIESPIVSEKDFVWYVEQKEAWKVLTQKDKTNETAWLNYYNAARYMSWFQRADSTAKQVVREMEQAIPASYTFNFCAYRESVQGKGYGDPKKYAEAALSMLPDDCRVSSHVDLAKTATWQPTSCTTPSCDSMPPARAIVKVRSFVPGSIPLPIISARTICGIV